MSMLRWIAVAAALSLSTVARAAPTCHDVPEPKKASSGETSVTLSAATLLNQNGRTMRFDREVVGDRIVVIDFVYTTCTTVCPVLSAVFSRLQKKLGDQVGKDVLLVSVSLDPVRDRPARLKAYAAKHGARDGWVWLTGEAEQVEQVLQGLGATTRNFADHPPMVLVGDAKANTWSRFNGFPDVDRLHEAVEALVAARASR